MKKNVKWILVTAVAVAAVWYYMKKKKTAAPVTTGVGNQMA